MTSKEIRQKFIQFFEKKGHVLAPSSSLVPRDDPSVLLTTAGMQPFKKHFMGEASPYGNRVVSIQKCFRTSDIDEVGDDTHQTFFEMLGNFSFGDYFKEAAIAWAYGFLTETVGIDKDRLSATYFAGDDKTLEDIESLKELEKLDLKEVRSSGREDNFWGPTGDEGPCGPTVEFYVDGVEIWNLVFNEYYCDKKGELKPLESRGVDTGMGFERLVTILQNKKNAYETDLFDFVIKGIEEAAGIAYGANEESDRVVRQMADHLRAIVFLIGDGVVPSNKEVGYVLRRLLRRVINQSLNLGNKSLPLDVGEKTIIHYGEVYPALLDKKNDILAVISGERDVFEKTLAKGLLELEKSDGKDISGWDAFDIFSTYGLPLEVIRDWAEKRGLKVDVAGFEREFEKAFIEHQELSRAGVEKKFGGHGLTGEIDEGDKEYLATLRNHTATHLLQQALRDVLGTHIEQKGSDVNAERLRFDFVHSQKLTDDEKDKIEKMVNEKIAEALPVVMREVSLDQARTRGALGVFDEQYKNLKKVKIYIIGSEENPYSTELCGGPHVQNTAEIKSFKIIKEESSSAGIRRIKAATG